jgi:hypothetical protein
MAKLQERTPTGKIFDNILFLEEVFGDRANNEIPKVPVLELARCFDLPRPTSQRVSRRRQKEWPLWK